MGAVVFIQGTTSIGYIIPDIVLEAIGTDRTVTTENPIEVGTPSCDHAYRRPAEILMRVGWSNSTHQQDGYVQQVYNALIALKNSYQLLEVMTAKRTYSNMLIESCILHDDVTTPFAAMCTISCKEILITSGSNAGGGSGASSGDGNNPAATPADPSQAGAVGDTAAGAGISQGVGDYSAAQFGQVGGLTNTSTPSVGSVPGNAFTGQYSPSAGYPANVFQNVTPLS